MNMETQCCNDRCKKDLVVGQVVYEMGTYRYCEDCVVVSVVPYPRLIPGQRKGGSKNAREPSEALLS